MTRVDLTIVAISILISGWYVLFKPIHDYVYLLPFALAYFFYIQVGTRWTPAKVIPIILIVGIAMRSVTDRESRRVFGLPNWMLLFFVVLLTSTLLNYVELNRGQTSRLDTFQTPGFRTFIQFSSYLLSFVFFLIPRHTLFQPQDVRRFIGCYVLASTVLCIYGVYQLVAYYADLPFRGVMYGPSIEGIGRFKFGEITIPRLNGLANEPKHLSAYLLPSITILALVRMRLVHPFRKVISGGWNFMLHSFVFILTFSTSGFLALLLLTPMLVFLLHHWGIFRFGRATLIVVYVIFIAVFCGGYLLQVTDVLGLFYTRTIEPILEQKRLEHHVLSYLQRFPQYLLIGMGPGNYNFHIAKPAYEIESAASLQILSSGVLTLIVDVGLIGCAVLFITILSQMRRGVKLFDWVRGNPPLKDAMLMTNATLISVLCLIPFLNTFQHLMMFMGISAVCNRMASVFQTQLTRSE